MIVHDVIQRTPEWRLLRAGRLCASDAKDMLAFIKSGEAAARRDLRMRLVTERLTGEPVEEGFVNEAMLRGILVESDARRAYEVQTGVMVEQVGFVGHRDLMAGCSPDGFVEEGLLELKCPKSATHVKYLRTDALLADYRAQVTHALWITGRPWCDLVSYDNRLPEHLQLAVVRVSAASLDLPAYEKKARAFLDEVDLDVAALRGWRGAA